MNILERLRSGVSTRSAEETRALAAELAPQLPADATLALHGDLGVGKTTFVQGLALGFGITLPVASPTFTIYTLYRGPVLLVHLDAYRLNSAAEMDPLLLDDFLVTPYCLAIEWPERIAPWLPADTWHLRLGILREKHTIQLA